ncbi:polyprenyl synthetase family protein [Microbacterium sp.]|uniref:polyprenyl synthetase family protein n=1 Tax=Microbacterium sp. TaxID=51671 RepID=UPI002C17CF32|nr:polyprenyl synthetase family protein [Microbacterium sp.]HWK77622.1 polyprenyl synthetase family protein [Microbacterium sp.]
MSEGTAQLATTFDERLREILAAARRRARSYPASFEQLWEALATMASGGKKLRPRLLMDAYAALGGSDERSAMDAACAVELLHLAFVIHDDVIDRDLTRRGELNITGRFAMDAVLLGAEREDARVWGEASSILAGDLMLTTAHSIIARLDVDAERRHAMLDALEDAVHESAAGEHSDVWLSLHLEPSGPEDVLRMVERKTAAYSFQAPLVLAAILAGASASAIVELTGIARRIGVIYQLQDDVLGLFGDEERTGKSTLSDLREGKETLLVAYARTDPAWAAVAPLFGDGLLDEAGGQRLRRVIQDSGALRIVESVIGDRCDEVHRLIRDAGIPVVLRDQLAALTYACSSRDS